MTKQKLAVNTWSDYDIGDPSQASKEELVQAVRRAAKAANQRLLRLERAGHTNGIYENAMYDLVNRRRFRERTEKLSLNELRHEYKILRSFLSAKSSTVQGRQDIIDKRYKTAQDRGFSGSLSDFEFEVVKYFSDNVERLFSSDVIYQSITGGHTDIIDAAVRQFGSEESKRGAALLYYLKRKESRKRE